MVLTPVFAVPVKAPVEAPEIALFRHPLTTAPEDVIVAVSAASYHDSGTTPIGNATGNAIDATMEADVFDAALVPIALVDVTVNV